MDFPGFVAWCIVCEPRGVKQKPEIRLGLQDRWCSDLKVCVLDFGLSILGSSSGLNSAFCLWARHFTLIVPLFTKVYKWVLANLMLRSSGNRAINWYILIQGGVEILLIA